MTFDRHRIVAVVLTVALSFVGCGSFATSTTWAGGPATPIDATAEALDAFNRIRFEAGLPPLAIDPALQQGTQEHACWMVQNNQIIHGATQGTPGYTELADEAGQKSNIALNSEADTTATSFMNDWAAGPYHLAAMLRPNLLAIGYGQCSGASGVFKAGATLDILSDLASLPSPRPLVTFPGSGATTHLTTYVEETVDPVQNCPGYTAPTGLPLLAMLPEAPAASTIATLVGPNGPVELCVVTRHNEANALGRAILAYDQSVMLIPRFPLTFGTWTATIQSGAQFITWTFGVDPSAPWPPGPPTQGPVPGPVSPARPAKLVPLKPCRLIDTRLNAPGFLIPGSTLTLAVAGRCDVPAEASAVALTITSVSPIRTGFFSIFPSTSGPPLVSTLNVVGGAASVRANGALTTLGTDGGASIVLNAGGFVVVDVTAAFVQVASSTDGRLVTVTPTRLLDTRDGGRPAPNSAVRIPLPAGVPTDAVALAVNVTTTQTSRAGFVSVYPAGTDRPIASILNADAPGQTRAAAAIVPVNADGFDLYSLVGDHVLVDIVGYFTGPSAADSAGGLYVADAPRRIADSRNGWGAWAALETREVVPGVSDASALALNVTQVFPATPGFLTLYPSGATVPTVSAVNATTAEVAANAAIVPVTGPTFILFSRSHTHVVVDRVGWFTAEPPVQ